MIFGIILLVVSILAFTFTAIYGTNHPQSDVSIRIAEIFVIIFIFTLFLGICCMFSANVTEKRIEMVRRQVESYDNVTLSKLNLKLNTIKYWQSVWGGIFSYHRNFDTTLFTLR